LEIIDIYSFKAVVQTVSKLPENLGNENCLLVVQRSLSIGN